MDILRVFRLSGSLIRVLKELIAGSKNILGLVICVILFCAGFVMHGNLGLYFNLAGLLVVAGGTIGALLICFETKRLAIVRKVLWSSYRTRVKEPEEIVEIMGISQ